MIEKISLLVFSFFAGSVCAAGDYHKTSCGDLFIFREQGLLLTPQKTKVQASCEIHAKGHSRANLARKWSGFGLTVERHADGLVYVDGKPASLDESTENAKVYTQGLNQIVIYNNGRANLVTNEVVQGWLQ